MVFKGRFVLLILLLGLVAAGCGKGTADGRAKLSGKVTYNGAPVTGGMIYFHAAGGPTYSAALRPDGTYLLPDVLPGDMTVTIDTESLNPKTSGPDPKGRSVAPVTGPGGGKGQGSPSAMMRNMMSKPPEGVNAAPAGAYVKIPAKYADRAKSGLSVTVTGGSQTKNFELTD